ncbi:MAG: Bor family protein [Leptothrix ochracea]|uniref:Bor family protein n=1 Tax=Leptothrix ochracea TaxID=735331 RepID=UPI0034E2DE4E
MTHKTLFLTALIVVLGGLGGCATQGYTLRGGGAPEPDLSTSQAFFFSGIGQSREIDAVEVCHGAKNIARLETVQTGLDILLTGLTLGIYTPRTAQVYCIHAGAKP